MISCLKDKKGQPYGFLKITHDLTASKQAEDALRRSEERFRLLVEEVRDYAIIMLDTDGRVVTWNSGAERIKGYHASDIVGRHFSCFYPHEAIRQGWPAHELEVASAAGRFEDEGWRVRKDGTRFWANVIITAIHDRDGRIQGFSKVTRDLTERKLFEQLQEHKSQQLRALSLELTRTEQRERVRLARVLHDHIQQLLVAARLNLATIKDWGAPPQTTSILAGVERLLGEAADASRSLAVDLCPPILREGGLVPALFWLADRMQETHAMTVAVDAHPRDDPRSESARYLLFDAARELLFNVVKHARTSQAHVSLQRELGGRMVLKVSDQGAGMDLAQWRGDYTSRGFGLLHLRERAEAQGGGLTLKSSPEAGTFVTLFLSDSSDENRAGEERSQPVASLDAPMDRPVEPAPVRPDGIQVLVVDDHDIVRHGLVGLLRGCPDIIVAGEAADGVEAVDKAVRLRPDVVVMDVNMPIMNGIEATRRIHARAAGVAVIGLSVHPEAEMARQMKDAGACAYVAKTAPAQDLIAAIRSCSPRHSPGPPASLA